LRLADEGRLDLDRPVADYLPEWFAQAQTSSPLERVGRLKLRLILGHLSGISVTYFLDYPDYDPFRNLRTYLADVNLKHPPGTKYLRSGAMIDLLGVVLQSVSGQPFATLAEASVFGPLGMDASSFRYQDSPRFASLRYKSAAPDSYATRVPGFREAVVPCGSMQSSLHDLAIFGSTLLGPGAPLLSPAGRDALFTPQDASMAKHLDPPAGCVWRLSLPELAYLGRVAWYSGKFFSHRCFIVLLPDGGLGAVCATNAWSIIDRETLLPMAVEVLKAQAREGLGIPEPKAPRLSPVPLGANLRAKIRGTYASTRGVYQVDTGPTSLRVASSALDVVLVHTGGGRFRAVGEGPVASAVYADPDTLSLVLPNGVQIEALRALPGRTHQAWLQRRGIYRLATLTSNSLYAVALDSFGGLPVISGDDGVQFLIEPRPDGRADIRCDESSRLFGRDIAAPEPGVLRLGEVTYRLNR